MSPWAVIGAVLAGAITAVPAAAAGPPPFTRATTAEYGFPASLPSGRAARQAGLEIVWPVSNSVSLWAAGSEVRVRVRALRKAGPIARVMLRRLSAGNGAALKRINSVAFRHGTFRARLAAHYGTPYVLTLDAGRLHYRSYLQAPPSPTQTDTRVPTQAGCTAGLAEGAPQVTLTVSRALLHPGDTFSSTLVNQTPYCTYASYAYTLQRREEDGGWATPPTSELTSLPAVALSLPANGTLTTPVRIPSDYPAGTYRVIKAAGLRPEATAIDTVQVLAPGTTPDALQHFAIPFSGQPASP
jgi:hypothetical protein